MTSLESIVLPLEQSRALVEKGIVLDTAMVSFNRGDDSWELVTREWALHVTRLPPFVPDIPRPVLSELLDAIRWAVHPMVLGWDGTGWTVRWVELDDRNPLHECSVVRDSTDLLAAYALLMEVAK